MNGDKNILSDEAIIKLYFNRDETAISETDRKYRQYLFSVAYNVLHNDADCDECLNDTYYRTWNAIPPNVPKILKLFLAKITRNLAFDRYDEAKRSKRIPAEISDSLDDFEGFVSTGKTPDEEMEAKEIGRIISDYLKQTSDKRLYVFISRYYFAMPVKDIASKLNCSESSVNKEIKAIKTELSQKLNEEGMNL